MDYKELWEFDATSFLQGQAIQQAIQSAPQAMSEADKIITYVLMGIGVGAIGGGLAAIVKDKLGSLNPIPAIKHWFSDRQKRKALEPIIDRLKQDPEVMKYVANKNLRGIQSVIKSKLSSEEQKYIGSLTRSALSEINNFTDNIEEAKAIGKTKSGKDIYLDFNNPSHKDFTAADHDDASQALLTGKSYASITPARKANAKLHFNASKAKQKGITEAKQEWAVQNIEALINDYATKHNLTLTPVDKKQQTNQYGSKKTIYIYKLGDKDLVMIDDKAAGAPRLNDFKVVIGTMEPGTTVLKNTLSVSKFGSWGTSDIIKILDKAFGEKLNENYARFRNETKIRTKPEQFHNAVKSVKQKVNEINRLFEYMNRLQSELSESEGGLKHKKYTDKAIQSIKESTKQLFFKSTKLK
jgi:hypothetical protein